MSAKRRTYTNCYTSNTVAIILTPIVAFFLRCESECYIETDFGNLNDYYPPFPPLFKTTANDSPYSKQKSKDHKMTNLTQKKKPSVKRTFKRNRASLTTDYRH